MSLMWLAIDHTVRFAPSSRPPIEPVVSTANTTSIRCPAAGFGGGGSVRLPDAHGLSQRASATVAAAVVEIPKVAMRWRSIMTLSTRSQVLGSMTQEVYGAG